MKRRDIYEYKNWKNERLIFNIEYHTGYENTNILHIKVEMRRWEIVKYI
jgi:hypothetical protein